MKGGNWYDRKNQYYMKMTIAEMKRKPTQQQKKYYSFMVDKCNENNVEPMLVKGEYRTEYDNAIKVMRNKLVSLGIDIHWDSKPKYKFDKFGNVIEIATGKVVRKA